MVFTEQELTEIRKTLNERKIVLEESRHALERPEFRSLFLSTEDASENSSEDSLSQAPSENILKETLYSLAQQLGDVTAAESRLALGSFGRCELCESQLSHSLLRDIPEARFCLRCSL